MFPVTLPTPNFGPYPKGNTCTYYLFISQIVHDTIYHRILTPTWRYSNSCFLSADLPLAFFSLLHIPVVFPDISWGDSPPPPPNPKSPKKNTQNTKNIKKCIEFTPQDMCFPRTWSLELTLPIYTNGPSRIVRCLSNCMNQKDWSMFIIERSPTLDVELIRCCPQLNSCGAIEEMILWVLLQFAPLRRLSWFSFSVVPDLLCS